MRLSWSSARRLLQRRVQRILEMRETAGLQHLGVDEKRFLRGQSYMTILTDIGGKRVLEVVPAVSWESATAVLPPSRQSIRPESRPRPWTAAQPLSRRCRKAIRRPPSCMIPSNLAANLHKTVDQVWCQNYRSHQSSGDATLSGTK